MFFCAIRRFFFQRHGSTSVEAALLAPIYLAFMIGIIEVSLMTLTQHVMESAVYNASRLGKTGYVTSGSTRDATVRAKLFDELNVLSPLVDTNKVTFTTMSYASLSALAASSSNGTSGYGSSGDIVVYQISYPWDLEMSVINALLSSRSSSSTLTLTARMVVKNEPYD